MRFHTYIDWTLEEHPRPFYVGKGNEGRTRNPERNNKHKHVRKQYGFNREIVFTSDDERECLQKEVELIAEHHTFVNDELATEVACNFTLGGEGASGFKHSPEACETIKLAVIQRYTSSEERKKTSEITKRWCQTPEGHEHMNQIRHKWKETEEGQIKRSQAHSGKHNHMYGKRGENHPTSKLTQQQANEIRTRLLVETVASLASEFSVSRLTIRRIRNNQIYVL